MLKSHVIAPDYDTSMFDTTRISRLTYVCNTGREIIYNIREGKKICKTHGDGRATNINNVAKLKMFTVYYGWYEGHEAWQQGPLWLIARLYVSPSDGVFLWILPWHVPVHATIFTLPPHPLAYHLLVSIETPYRSILSPPWIKSPFISRLSSLFVMIKIKITSSKNVMELTCDFLINQLETIL